MSLRRRFESYGIDTINIGIGEQFDFGLSPINQFDIGSQCFLKDKVLEAVRKYFLPMDDNTPVSGSVINLLAAIHQTTAFNYEHISAQAIRDEVYAFCSYIYNHNTFTVSHTATSLIQVQVGTARGARLDEYVWFNKNIFRL